jgi:putative ATP-dependent endonuclease of the OLD family
MKIKEVDIRNFRALSGERVSFNDYTCLVGSNGAGKSTVLNALKVFFRDTTVAGGDVLTLKEEDFHLRNTDEPIVITVKFHGLEEEAQKDFAHYYRQGLLIVSAVAKWDRGSRSAEVKQFGQRMAMEAFSGYFKADEDGAPATELKKMYEGIRGSFKDLPPQSTKPVMKEALRSYEAGHPDLCAPIQSEDQFYGFSRGLNLLQKYVQWICVPAVKDAASEQLEARNNALKMLLERTVRAKLSFKEPLDKLRLETEEKYRAILKEHQGALESLSESLSARLKDWAHPDASLKVQWHDESSEYVNVAEPLAQILAGEGRFEGTLSCFGHGLQRSFLLALLQELAGAGNLHGPTLLLACEEPELYQHPPQAKHLASVLDKLSGSNSQVLVSTHSPFFTSGRGFEDIRFFRPNPGLKQSNVHSVAIEELSKTIANVKGESPAGVGGMSLKVEQTLTSSINEMFFTSVLVLVEGPEDAAHITTYLTLMGHWEDFRRLGCHIVPTYGKPGMIQPLAIATMFGIPTYVVFDADGDEQKVAERKKQQNNNIALLRLCGVGEADPFPAAAFRALNACVWPIDIGRAVKGDIGEEEWSRAAQRVHEKLDIDVTNLQKNPPFIGYVLCDAWEHGARSKHLCEVCDAIIQFASEARKSRSETVREGAMIG